MGKSSSRSFVERIPSHFDPRLDGWFDTLPEKLMKHDGLAEYPAAHSRSLEMNSIMLGFKRKDTMNAREGILRSQLQPTLNPDKKERYWNVTLLRTANL
jgi:hypothetical protein